MTEDTGRDGAENDGSPSEDDGAATDADADAVADASADDQSDADDAAAALSAAQAALNMADADAEAAGDPVPDADAAATLAAAQTALADAASTADTTADAGDGPAPFTPPMFESAEQGAESEDMELLGDVDLHVTIELGRTRMLIEDVLKLGDGAIVELDKLAGDPVDVLVNGRHVATGEVLVLNDNFCVRINELTDPLAEPRDR